MASIFLEPGQPYRPPTFDVYITRLDADFDLYKQRKPLSNTAARILGRWRLREGLLERNTVARYLYEHKDGIVSNEMVQSFYDGYLLPAGRSDTAFELFFKRFLKIVGLPFLAVVNFESEESQDWKHDLNYPVILDLLSLVLLHFDMTPELEAVIMKEPQDVFEERAEAHAIFEELGKQHGINRKYKFQ